MGAKLKVKDANMQRQNSNDDTVRENCNGSDQTTSSQAANTNPPNVTIDSQNCSGEIQCPSSPTNANSLFSTPHGQGSMHHSHTNPNLQTSRPRSAHHHRIIGRILRAMGDGYCSSCGIALRQMGDQLSGEYEVRRAFSTGDLPNSVKDT